MRSPPLVPQGLPPAPLYAIVPPFDADARGNDEGGDIEDIEDIDHDPVDRGGGSVVFYLDCLTDDLNDLFVSEDNEERVCLADRQSTFTHSPYVVDSRSGNPWVARHLSLDVCGA